MNVTSFQWLLIVVAKIIYFVNGNWITGNLCWSMPCLNGGSCFGSAYTYLCVCPVNFSGALCERHLGICQESPCGNRGVCVETGLTSFECRCYFDYMGPLCEEHVPKNDASVWSSLIPVHTRVLFDILQEAYRAKAQGRSAVLSSDGHVNIMSLLPKNNESSSSTSVPTTMSTILQATSINSQSETTEEELVIQAEDIKIEEIFPTTTATSIFDMSTENFTAETFESTQPYDANNDTITITYPETYTTSPIVTFSGEDSTTTMLLLTTLEDMTTVSLNQNTSVNITEDEEYINITESSDTMISSTFSNWSNDNNTITYTTEIIQNSTEQIDSTSNKSEELTTNIIPTTSFETSTDSSFATDDNLLNTSEEITTSSMITTDQLLTADNLIDAVNITQTSHSQLLYKLCQQLISKILPNVSSSSAVQAALSLATNSSLTGNNSVGALFTWIQEKFHSSTTTTTTTLPTVISGKKMLLQRVDMDDVLHQMNNNIDDEH
ncbi:unnamed protein product [Adineta steineri]|uniref:EGF-like domain-containing protein n=1 Tax=Adineta steineri TaxID=433720 RepID=A0A814AYY6_9BILA|nr:unnamed protein product [Adineta steineri]CAF3962530.1 unnamed protein product [Adineta steineri]